MNILLFKPPGKTSFLVAETISTKHNITEVDSNQRETFKQRIHRIYWKLTEKIDHQETLCAQLRHAEFLKIHHSNHIESQEAAQELREFLRLQQRKHSRWFCVDFVLAFFGIFLTPIPGPNLFFFYPAARALGHYLARKGAHQSLLSTKISFQKDSLVDHIEQNFSNKKKLGTLSSEIENRYNIKNFEHILSRLEGK